MKSEKARRVASAEREEPRRRSHTFFFGRSRGGAEESDTTDRRAIATFSWNGNEIK
jgi:hypothetical protein